MRVALDARLSRSPTGMGTYTRELIRGLANGFPSMTLLSFSAGDRLFPPHPRLRESVIPIRRRWLWSELFLTRWLRHEGADVYHALDGLGVPPHSPCPVIATFHDIIPLTHPQLVSLRTNVVFRTLVRPALRRARMVVAVSHHTRAELERSLGVPSERVRVIPLGVSGDFSPGDANEAHRRVTEAWGIDPPYLIAFGRETKRKNLHRVMEAVAGAARESEEPLTLALVGGSPTHVPRGFNLVEIGDLSEQELAILYRGASALFFPSLAEGFGLPPLEAMACGAPVLLSDIPAHREVAGPGGLMVDPHDTRAMVRGLTQILTSREKREELRRKGLERSALFRWEDTAGATGELYREVHQETPERSHSRSAHGPTTT